MKKTLFTLLLTLLSIPSASFAATVNTFTARLNADFDSATPNYPNGLELIGVAQVDESGSMSVNVSGFFETPAVPGDPFAPYLNYFLVIEVDITSTKNLYQLSDLRMNRFEITALIFDETDYSDTARRYDIYNIATPSIDLNFTNGYERQIYFDVATSFIDPEQAIPYVLTLSEVPLPATLWLYIASIAGLRLMAIKKRGGGD